jgi:hypothetical protein
VLSDSPVREQLPSLPAGRALGCTTLTGIMMEMDSKILSAGAPSSIPHSE